MDYRSWYKILVFKFKLLYLFIDWTMDLRAFIQNSKLKKCIKCIRYTKLYKMLKVKHS